MELKKYKLADIGKVITGKTPSTSIAENYAWGTIPFYTPEDVAKGLGMMGRNSRFISKTGFEEIASNTISGESVLVGCIGSDMGNVAYSNITCATNQQINAITQFKNGIEPLYVYYLLSTMKSYFQKIAGSTTTPILPKSVFEEIEIHLPDMKKQKDVVSILYALDRKIELNKQINDNLEAQLRLITSRYIFSCPNLEKKRIGEIATVKAGGDCPITFSKTRTQKCNIPIFSNGTEDRGLYGFTNKANIEGHSITVAARGTIGYCERRLMPFVPIIRLLAITPKVDGAYIYLHQVIRGMKFKKNGSVQQQLTVPEISFIEIPYPHSSVLHEYNKVASPIVEMIERNISENEILTKQRDELLPLLMNGQATVNYHLSDD